MAHRRFLTGVSMNCRMSNQAKWPGHCAAIVAMLAVAVLVAVDAHAASGRVINEVTGKPIEGVFVRVTWYGSASLGPQARSGCYKTVMTQSDKDGKFSLPDWSLNFNPLIWGRHRSVGYYFTDFEESPNNDPKGLRDPPEAGDVLMRPFAGDVKERLQLLAGGLDDSCMSPIHLGQKLFPYYDMKYEEAKRLATKPEHQSDVSVAKEHRDAMGLRAGILKQGKDGAVTK